MELRGIRALIVEDEAFLRLELSDMLQECGCRIVGAAGRVQRALQLIDEFEFDIALLDVNLGHEQIDPVVTAVEQRGVPFVFLTGYGKTAIEGRSPVPVVEKPYERAWVVAAMLRALGKDR